MYATAVLILILLLVPIGAPAYFGPGGDTGTFDPDIIGEGPDPFDDLQIIEDPDPIPGAKRDDGK